MTSVNLLSFGFLLCAGAAIASLAILRGAVRQAAFLAVNVAFVWTLLGRAGTYGIVAFTLFGYLCFSVISRRAGRGLTPALVALIAAFVYMRRYDFLEWLLPASLLTSVLRTAGLSFVLFKIIHVLIDARSGTLGRLEFPTYVNYCLNFTTFAMGPIQRFQDYRDQWEGIRDALPPTFEAHLDALLRALWGLIKAYVLAGVFLGWALGPDTDLLALSFPALVGETYAFWFYLYLNFSGYCDVVIGVGSLMGIRPPENFNKPFLATNISDFWLRQHRSLTLWLTDYVFSPVYGRLLSVPWTAQHKLFAANAALMITMLVSGLWHGTTVSFLLFGLIHGLWFVIYRSWDTVLLKRLGRSGARELRSRKLMRVAGMVLTFNATAFTFIFFRVSPERIAQTFSQVFTR